MKNIIIPIVVFIAMSISSFAQEEKSRRELRGDKYVFRYAYDKAIDAYTHTKNLTVEGQRRLAESYHNLNQNVEAEEVYAKLINKAEGVLPEDHYNYATVLKINGKYDEAARAMDKFAELKPTDLRARNYIDNKAELSNLLKDDGKYKINQLDVNTDAEDFGTSYYKDKIVFTSSRSTPKMIVRKYTWTKKPFWDMYVSEVKDGQLQDAKKFNRNLNSKLHDGPASFSNDGTFMAFTRNNCKDKTKDKVVEIQILFSSYKDEKWSKPEPFVLNNEGYSVGHPCLTSDGNSMYFTSDMPGGYGGADLYKTTKVENGEWGKAENLGKEVNTEGDEMFPFIEEKSKILFFASNGRFGLGGMDIFMCAVSGSVLGRVVNVGFPLNTQYDDFAVMLDTKTNTGYFSSNRVGGNGNDDVYAFDLLKAIELGKKIEGIAKDKEENPIAKTFITLFDDKNNITDTLTTTDDGAYAFLVGSDKSFKLIGRKEKYLDGENVVNTFGEKFIVKADVILLKKVEKEKEKEEIVVVKKLEIGDDLGKIFALNTIYFDFDEAIIRPDAKIELDKIIKIMNENPKMVVEFASYTDCRAPKTYNQVLSDKRAKASAAYIKKGITKPERIHGKGYGETKLVNGCSCEGVIVSDCKEEDFQKDRRTEFIILDNGKISKK